MLSAFRTTRLSYLIPIALLVPALIILFLQWLFNIPPVHDDFGLVTVCLEFLSLVLTSVFIWLVWLRDLKLNALFPALPDSNRTIKELVLVTIPLFLSAYALIYLLYVPLSYLNPGYVREWLTVLPPVYVDLSSPWAMPTNLISVLFVAALVPVFEETVFRGFILGRLYTKIKPGMAIIASSMLFALLHADVLGAFLFSVFVSLIYLRYKTLLAPILVHTVNNLLSMFISYVELLYYGWDEANVYRIADFRADIWIGIVAAIVSFPWLYHYYQRRLKSIQWRDFN